MKRRFIVLLFFVAIFSAFSYGLMVDQYEIFPFEFLKDAKNAILEDSSNIPIDYTQYIFEDDVKSLIQISSEEDVNTKKANLIEFIWSGNGFPSTMPTAIEEDIADDRYSDLNNLKQIDKITISMDNGIDSVVYLFHAEQQLNNDLIIYHQGHKGDFIEGKDTIQFFLENGFSVMGISMPLLGMNNQPVVDLPQFGKTKLLHHNYFELLESPQLSPIKYFVEPVAVALNYIDENYNFDKYHMVGISGGGWTAVLYSAIDHRISHAYSIAGSIPFFLRSIPDNLGDYEQRQPDLYNIANYLELYVLASFGNERKLVQIFNKYDPCCFSGEISQTYDNHIKLILSQLKQGNFEVHIDETHKEHDISNHGLEIILDSLS